MGNIVLTLYNGVRPINKLIGDMGVIPYAG